VAAEIPLAAGTIAAAVGGRLVEGDRDHYVTGFSIDSRTLATGDLFFAIVAVRDGHEYVGAAARRRAAGVVVSRPVVMPEISESFVIEVGDTTRGLQDLARHVRRESGATVVAITGSAGKTTTKDVIAELVSGAHRVLKNRGNLNNHLGLPLSLLELRHGADVAVMELGMNHAGEIRALVDVARPEVRVWTNVGEAHLGHFGSADRIADAKAEILDGADATTVLVANADDPRVTARTGAFPGRRVTFGLSAVADVRAMDVEDLGLEGTKSRLVTPVGERDLRVPLLGRGHLMNVLAATAVALELRVDLDDVVNTASRLQPSERRGVTLRLPKGVTVIDDSYNSSPAALKLSLDVLSRTWAARRIAVLGEMLELGELSPALHQDCGRIAAASRVSRLITVGGAAWLIRRLREFQIGQVIRQAGPESHRAKAGTPTMGGLLILAAHGRGARLGTV